MVMRKRYKKATSENLILRRKVIKEDDFLELLQHLLESNSMSGLKIDLPDDYRSFLVLPKTSIFKKFDISSKIGYTKILQILKKQEAFTNKLSRKSEYTLKRHACFHILKTYYPEVKCVWIAKDFSFHHSSIIHGCKNTNNLLSIKDAKFTRIYHDCLALFNIKVLDLKPEQQNSNDTIPTDIN